MELMEEKYDTHSDKIILYTITKVNEQNHNNEKSDKKNI